MVSFFLSQDQDEIIEHEFCVGWRLECVNPQNLTQICPASVTTVIDQNYFIVEIDDLLCAAEEKIQCCCHSNSHGLFPVGWSSTNGLKLTPPQGLCSHQKDKSSYRVGWLNGYRIRLSCGKLWVRFVARSYERPS